jgi:hypothetical protein
MSTADQTKITVPLAIDVDALRGLSAIIGNLDPRAAEYKAFDALHSAFEAAANAAMAEPAQDLAALAWKLEYLGKIMQGVARFGHDPDIVPWSLGVAKDIVRLLESGTPATDADAKIKGLWQAFCALDSEPGDEGDPKIKNAQAAKWGKAHKAVASAPAFTVQGLAIKLQLLAQEATEGRSAQCDAILATSYDVMKRLAPDVVSDLPNREPQNEDAA